MQRMGQFRPWVKKMMPTVYDDTLTYYELLTKVIGYLNQLIDQGNSIIDYVDAIDKEYNSNWTDFIRDYNQMVTELERELDNRFAHQDNDIYDNHQELLSQMRGLQTEFNDLRNWAENEGMPNKIAEILNNWLDSGDLAHIINNEVFDMKADKTFVDAEISRLNETDENLTAQLAQKATQLQSDKTIFVDNANGSDTNDGTSEDNAFKTIQQAINSIPTVVTGHVVIKIADGTYTEQNLTWSGAAIDTYSEKTMSCNIYFTNFQIKEGSSITLLGNVDNPENVVIDGLNTISNNIFIFNTNRVNIYGLTAKNAIRSNIHYKRYSSGQVKNLILDNANYGLWAYQYVFLEIQGKVTFKNIKENSIYGLVNSYVNVTGADVENTCVNGLAISVNTVASLSQTNNFNASRYQFIASDECHISATNVNVNGAVGNIRGGTLDLSNCNIVGGGNQNNLILRSGAKATLINTTFENDVPSDSALYSGIHCTELSTLYMSGGGINGYYFNVGLRDGSKAYFYNTDLSNAKYEGINMTDSEVIAENVTSTTPNNRNGVQNTRGLFHNKTGNTITGTGSQYVGFNGIYPSFKGTTNDRPTSFIEPGVTYYDTSLFKVILYIGSAGWRNLDGSTL